MAARSVRHHDTRRDPALPRARAGRQVADDRGRRKGGVVSRQRSGRRRPVVWPWLLIVLWICVIWGHSLMPGDESGLESQWVADLLRRGAAWLGLSDRPLVRRLLTDRELLHLVVRKGAHFSEYFVLGVLTFNALRLTFREAPSQGRRRWWPSGCACQASTRRYSASCPAGWARQPTCCLTCAALPARSSCACSLRDSDGWGGDVDERVGGEQADLLQRDRRTPARWLAEHRGLLPACRRMRAARTLPFARRQAVAALRWALPHHR